MGKVNSDAEASAPKNKNAVETKRNDSYFVSPHPDGGWQVKRTGAQRALKIFDTKAEADVYAKRVATNQEISVVRQKKDGKFQKKK